ncbi:hypothetical protein BU14_0285s0016 [Porphyra umbilicalis]|uniref:Uncharacterized protein n=1 Tax=Porphyra umbilicalis TaxID=2786 RepID=A0A1X6P0Z1_PORUM|nr:hypothetical protein BU14_0285s0016 [Porphyra umbilicalis]|eukprot:OSX74528.1 hypothetical protein BU14_0285s0016 [Porphyra umbilicalis]
MAPSAADRARKMEMRQEAAAVAAATSAAVAAATALVASSKASNQGADSRSAQDAASTMVEMATHDGPAPGEMDVAGTTTAVAPAASPATPRTRGKGKGKGRASHLGPSSGIAKTSRSAASSPVGVMSAGSAATPSSSATQVASRPPAYPLASVAQPVGLSVNPYALLQGVTPLYSGTAAARAPRNSTAPRACVAEAAPLTAADGPLRMRTATAAGFVVRTSPNAGEAAGRHTARTKGAISGASPVVTGVRRRTHRIPAARLARQLKAAGATAAAHRLNLAGDAAGGSCSGSFDGAGSPATDAGRLATLPAAAAPAAEMSGAPVLGMATGDRRDADNAASVVGGTGSNDANGSFLGVVVGGGADGSGASTAAEPSTPTARWVDVISAADVSDAGSAPPSTPGAPSVGGSVGGVSTPGPSDIESGPPSPSRPLTWRSTRNIPSPVVQIPLSTTPPLPAAATPNLGQSTTRATQVVETAVRASTANLRVDMAALSARTKDTAARLQQLVTKVDSSVNLSQQTLVAVRKVEAAVKAAISDVVKKGAIPDKEDAETTEQQAEKLLDDVKKAYRGILINEFAAAVETVAVFSNCDDNWDTVIDAAEACMKSGKAKAEAWLNQFIRRASRRNASIFVNVRVSMLVLRVKPHLHQTWTDLIVNTYFEALGLQVKNLNAETAKQLMEGSAYYVSVRGREACLDALAALFRAVGAASRITEPTSPTDGRVIRATLGHFAFVTTKIRNVVELAAGTRVSSRDGAVGDGHFPMWVAEVRRMDASFPKSEDVLDGLELVDGAALERSLPQY